MSGTLTMITVSPSCGNSSPPEEDVEVDDVDELVPDPLPEEVPDPPPEEDDEVEVEVDVEEEDEDEELEVPDPEEEELVDPPEPPVEPTILASQQVV